jgi:hypothetical protein
MSTLRAVVQNGRATVTDLDEYPDGTVVELAVVDDGDLTAEQQARLDASLDVSRGELEAGKGIAAEDVIRRLRSK